jgi:hypothetical protein
MRGLMTDSHHLNLRRDPVASHRYAVPIVHAIAPITAVVSNGVARASHITHWTAPAVPRSIAGRSRRESGDTVRSAKERRTRVKPDTSAARACRQQPPRPGAEREFSLPTVIETPRLIRPETLDPSVW